MSAHRIPPGIAAADHIVNTGAAIAAVAHIGRAAERNHAAVVDEKPTAAAGAAADAHIGCAAERNHAAVGGTFRRPPTDTP